MNYEEKARWGWTNLTKLGRGYEKTKTLRKGTATAQGCKRCKIEAHGDARWRVARERNPGRRREIQPRDSRDTAWCEKWWWITSDFPERGLHAAVSFMRTQEKKVHCYKHSFHHFVPGCQRILRSLHFFLQFPKLKGSVDVFWYTPFIYIYNIYINLCMYTHIYICMHVRCLCVHIYITIVYV